MTTAFWVVSGAPQTCFQPSLPYLLVHTTTEGKPIMGRRDNDDYDSLISDEPDYEAIVERRREYHTPSATERAELSYERYVTGY